ncbi:hypothetical protein TcG_09725 [Trypanosoma cruzi]|nr:hypothetical protein TcBrA4_0138460 [Trypanosoma cruzi]RNF09280.1 hypothetical protein TcG_09725 [Trypanosoma cruzi]
MCERALQLRRRCLFLSYEAGVGMALQCPEVARRAADILLYAQESSDRGVDGVVELAACTRRWMQSRQFSDWQECIEWLLFCVERQQEVSGVTNAQSALFRQTLLELTTLFEEEAREYHAAAPPFAEDYWRNAQKRQRLLSSGVSDERRNLCGTRMTWSIAAELPRSVEQAFLLP